MKLVFFGVLIVGLVEVKDKLVCKDCGIGLKVNKK
jgi:hypothetical protein